MEPQTPLPQAAPQQMGTPEPSRKEKTEKVKIETSGFNDSVKHYRDAQDTDEYPRYSEDRVVEIADNILLYQRDNGGWPKNWDPQRILSDEEKRQISAAAGKLDTTFDNRATYPQIEYLAEAYAATGDERFRTACERGLKFVLSAQDKSGGFPHSYPPSKDYHAFITFMDDVMPGVLSLLRKASAGQHPFAFVSPELKHRLLEALHKGDALLLKLQVVVDGKLTVWAGQYDPETLKPTKARAYELEGLVSDESVSVVRYLMSIEQPPEAVVRAVEAAVAWFRRSQIKGLRVEKVKAETVRYQYHTSTYDLVAVEDPAAPPIWARFYEIETNRPFMANRDGKKVYHLNEVHRERRTGYRWYGYFAQALLEREYPAYKARLEQR